METRAGEARKELHELSVTTPRQIDRRLFHTGISPFHSGLQISFR
jgi:hypothetical protein